MFFITFIAGLVALIADEQFGGQHTVGIVLLVITVGLFIIQLLLAAAVTTAAAKGSKRVRRGF